MSKLTLPLIFLIALSYLDSNKLSAQPCSPSTSAGEDKEICQGGSTTIGCDEVIGYCYIWHPITGLSDPYSAMPQASPNSTTTYTLTITDDSNSSNFISTDQVTVFVREVDLIIFKPSVIAGNIGTQIPDADEELIGAMTFVNIDNDDNDGQFDISDLNVNGGDDELVRLRIHVKNPDLTNNKVKIHAVSGAEFIKIWKSADKAAGEYLLDISGIGEDLPLDANGMAEVWVEGIIPHTLQRQTTLKVVYEMGGGLTCEDMVSLTIIGVESLVWEGIGNGFAPPLHESYTLDTNDPNFIGSSGPIQNSDGTNLLSYRVFSDARASSGFTTPKDEVKLKVLLTVAPVEALTMYLRAFDIDDPYTDPPPISGNPKFIDPNDDGIDGTYSGTSIGFTKDEDNRGQVAGGGKFGAFIAGDADGDGIATIDFPANDIDAEVNFKVSNHPGDNYRVAINGDQDYLQKLRNRDKDDGFQIVHQTSLKEVKFPLNYLSHVLTVWRILHVEDDSMHDYIWGSSGIQQIVTIANDFISPTNKGTNFNELTNTTHKLNYGDGSEHLDTPIPIFPNPNGRFENGTLFLGWDKLPPPGGVVPSINSIQIGPGNIIKGNGDNRIVLNGVASMAGIWFEITDNSVSPPIVVTGNINDVIKDLVANTFEWQLNGIAIDPTFIGRTLKVGGVQGSPIMTITGIMGTNSVVTNEFKMPIIIRDDDNNGVLPFHYSLTGLDAFLDAYLIWENDGGGPVGNNYSNDNISFIENLGTPSDYANINSNVHSAPHENDFFWIVYIATCWQSNPNADGDPESENGMPGSGGIVWGIAGDQNPLDPTGGLDHIKLAKGNQFSMIFRETNLDNPPPFGITGSQVVVHEIGHQFGLSHGDNFPPLGWVAIPEYPLIGLMCGGGNLANVTAFFIDRHLNLIRSIVAAPGF